MKNLQTELFIDDELLEMISSDLHPYFELTDKIVSDLKKQDLTHWKGLEYNKSYHGLDYRQTTLGHIRVLYDSDWVTGDVYTNHRVSGLYIHPNHIDDDMFHHISYICKKLNISVYKFFV